MIGYFDCFSGVSGDMVLGAMIDLGVPVDWLQEKLREMPLDGFRLRAEPLLRQGLRSINLNVEIDDHHTHRHYTDIRHMIVESPYSDRVKEQSQAIFETLARAEAHIHDCALEKVHLHEVGAIDALVDIVGSVLAMEHLGIQQLMSGTLPLGSGVVKCAHGLLPVPAPATLEILKGVPVTGGHAQMELVTPTGAAILIGLKASFDGLPAMQIEKIGYGAGKRETVGVPNLLRVILGRELNQKNGSHGYDSDTIVQIDTNLDDMNPEWYGFLMESLFAEGALDVFWTPVQMKKNRPATMVSVLCTVPGQERIIQTLMANSTTIGVRISRVERRLLKREIVEIETPLGTVKTKKIWNRDGTTRLVPEYEACRDLAKHNGLPLPEVTRRIEAYLQRFS